MLITKDKAVNIFLPQNAHSDLRYAANLLSGYLEKTVGAVAKIQDVPSEQTEGFYLGETECAKAHLKSDYEKIVDDGFICKSYGDIVILTGKDSVYSRSGTIYAVLEFLEKVCGIKFLSYDEELIPRKKSILIKNLDIRSNPDFYLRQILAASTRRHKDYTVKMRIKDAYCGDVPGGTLYPLWAGSQGHNFFEFCSPDEYGKEHPGWFSADKYQLCFTQSDSIDVITANLIEKIKREKDSKFFAFSQNDTVNPCKCEKCIESYKKYGVSGTMVRFINKIAKRVEQWVNENCPEREVYLVTFAYLFSIMPPVRKENGRYVPIDESVIPNKNVWIFFTTIEFCFWHDLFDQSCRWNKPFLDKFFGWKSLVGDRIMIWNYSANYAHYLYPFLAYKTYKNNYRFFKEQGVRYILDQGSCEGEFVEFCELKTYIQSKLLWNVESDVCVLMNEFIDNYYKQAAPYIKRYFELMQSRLEEIDKNKGYHLRVYHLPGSMFSAENFHLDFIHQLFDCFESALKEVEKESDGNLRETLKKRVTRGYISAKYLLLMNYSKYNIGGKGEFEEKFLRDCQYSGIKKYCENYKDVDTIYELIEKSQRDEVLKY